MLMEDKAEPLSQNELKDLFHLVAKAERRGDHLLRNSFVKFDGDRKNRVSIQHFRTVIENNVQRLPKAKIYHLFQEFRVFDGDEEYIDYRGSVSYTHLTLPTIYSV
eukprot:TRINITY_DN14096_c0_g1_i1.p1 TRINITY_DN14096_c0_g1~~TRINITY_DN14096_c0_g1_i1.p1  ORF type:complete len:106 (-),score=12.23 TRINITY_DN14096_c0_g1_i1:48-365(-)